MTDYCTECGGLPHADGASRAGRPGHFTVYGRRAPTPAVGGRQEAVTEVVVEDGPTEIVDHLSSDVPANAKKLAALPGDIKAVESRGVWKGVEQHYVGVAGVLANGVRFYSAWRKLPSGWKSEESWLRDEGGPRRVKWNDLWRGVKDGMGDERSKGSTPA